MTVGERLSHYRIVKEIGRGGMGVVYRAHDEHLGRDVAIKVLPQGTLADETARKRFRKEAEALSKLNHPNIQTVHDFDTQAGTAFLVMELIPGVTLSDKLTAGPLPEKETFRLGAQLAEGLAAAHDQGVVHRDLKPGNLRLTPDGRLKILDFGLAKLLPAPAEATTTDTLGETRAVAGTLPYMAPEQLCGERADVRSDIWAAGAVLYEMVTGQRPFPETQGPRLIDAILNQPPRPPSVANRRVSPGLESIILKCLEKDPEDRYQSVRELVVDLRRLSTGAPAMAVGRRRALPRYWAVAPVALAVLLAVVLAWNPGGWRDRLLGRGNPVRIESLAVLPLENLSHNPEQDYFADGMTEALITELGQIRGLRRVISRTSVMRYKTVRKPLREIASELNVDAVVEGSVLRSDGAVQVTARLVQASTDTQLWSQSYQRELRDVLALQREVALAIAKEIKVKLAPQEQARLATARPVNPSAHEAYLKGKHLSKGTYEQRRKAREYFEQTVRIDPNYAPGYAGLADSYWATPDLPAKEAMPKAKEYALKALAIDDTLAHAHRALASILFYGDWDWLAANEEFKHALELNPGDAEAHRMYSVYLSAMGRFEEALTEIRTAQELDPLSVLTNTTAGWTFYCARQYDRGAEQCQKTLELAPNSDGAHACLGYNYLAKGMYQQAIAECQKALTLSGGDAVRAVWLGRAYAGAGRRTDARKVLTELHQLSKRTYVPPYFLATLHVALGEKDQAFAWLQRAYAERDLYLAWLRVDPAVDPLRSDPRFQELLRRTGLSP